MSPLTINRRCLYHQASASLLPNLFFQGVDFADGDADFVDEEPRRPATPRSLEAAFLINSFSLPVLVR